MLMNRISSLGRSFHRRYSIFLIFLTCFKSARSTYIRRTIKSLIFMFSGLFGESYHENRKSETLFVLVEQPHREYLFVNPKADICREGLKECTTSKRHLEMKQKLKRILCVDKLIDDLQATECRQDCHIYNVRDDFIAREHSGFPLSPGLIELIPEMDRLSTEEMQWLLFGKECNWYTNIPRIVGPVLRMIVCNMTNYASLPKFHLYSCHDSTIIGLLIALRCATGLWPPFSADLILELYEWQQNVNRPPSAALVDCLCPKPDGHNTETAPTAGMVDGEVDDTPADWPRLWFRLLYLGKPVDLACLWQLPALKAVDYSEGFLPLSNLTDLWSDWLQDVPENMDCDGT